MKKFLQRLIKFIAYTMAGIVILLAVAVGLFRLFLPRLPEYQDELKAWASEAIGMQVEFSGMDARWRFSGPELNFYDAELIRPLNNTRLVAAEEVSIGVGLLRLLRDRTVVVDRILVRDTEIEVRERADGEWWIQGTTLAQLRELNRGAQAPAGEIEIVGEDVAIALFRLGAEQPTLIDVSRASVLRDPRRTAINASLRLPASMGRQLTVAATQLDNEDPRERYWDITVAGRGLELPGWTALVEDRIATLASGSASVDLSLRVGPQGIREVAAEFAATDVAASSSSDEIFATSGRLEYRQDTDGWLLALDDFVINSSNGSWPESSLRLEAGTTPGGELELIDLRSDYLNVADVYLALPWLATPQRDALRRYAPEGVFRNLSLSLADLHTGNPAFAMASEFEQLAFAPVDAIPGIRNLSGRIRADRSGGLADIDATDVEVLLPELLSIPVTLDDAYGTVIWRQSDNRITVLSDSIVLGNGDITTDSNVELIFTPDDGPTIDLSSSFSISDLAGVKRFIPDRILKPKLYEWFQLSLVSGSIRDGKARLYGPLRAFPFDNGEGGMLIEANVRDAEFKYLPQWPAARLLDVDIVLDGMHLYTNDNRTTSEGNTIVDARVDIPDLREPVLTIDGLARGTLDTLRRFGNASPIAQLFAGQLDLIEVSGDATLKLDLMVPIKRARDLEVSARIETTDGTALLPALRRPITDLAGVVTITKTEITSESLTGRFLERPVSFDLVPAPPELEGYAVVLNADGTITAAGLVEGLGLPASEFVNGTTDYSVSVLFPAAQPGEEKRRLAIEIGSDLIGMGIDLPAPFRKTAETPQSLAAQILLSRDTKRIETTGGLDDDLRWQLDFFRNDSGAWDFDRGVFSLGDTPPPPADTRGLHIRGQASEVVFEDWLALGKGAEQASRPGTLALLRSVDVGVDSLRLFGQHLVDHRVRLDRSARDWLVQFTGPEVEGAVFVPYDLAGDRPVVMDMERLVLPGDNAAPAGPRTAPDPRDFPALSIRAREFAIGIRHFGALEAEIARVEDGLSSRTIIAVDESFELVAEGSWLRDANDPLGSRTAVTATLNSSDVGTTLSRLGYNAGLVGDDMSALLDLNWSGGPGGDFLPSLDGEVQLRMGAGQLDEVEPGAGRVLGLMSIVALPRRLSLDFSDVFEKGFGFDEIEGTFRLDDGDAYTCNLSLEAPAADIAIIGRAGLVDRDYEQAALIGANVGNMLPAAAAVAAGPQVAVAVLIFSQIFKKPLQGMTQLYYSIDGSWDAPAIDEANAERFAEVGRRAGCVSEASPAE
ncbi:MAG: YhdP family protein [Woeseiaceae bacterium]|jgi:uncharacterized protein (TIGR02099 family)|nr:YhdP family protein [Woeseiaceae bacterium]